MNTSEQTSHQVMVEEFMKAAGQAVPSKPTIPSVEVRRLRAKLILEEALETISALGITVFADKIYPIISNDLEFEITPGQPPYLANILDGCCDLAVVTTGTLSACGIKDQVPQQIVDNNNLTKLEGWTGVEINKLDYESTKDYDIDRLKNGNYKVTCNGKLIKSPSHQPPDLQEELDRQSNL